MKAALVIVTFNAPEVLKKHLSSLESQTRIPDKIFIVNNGEDISEIVNEFGEVFIIEVMAFDNIGPAGGFREGAKKAYAEGFDYIIFADDDAFPGDDKMLSYLLEDAEKGHDVVGGYYTEGCKGGSSNHYFTIKRTVFEKTGFYFAPFFLMREDLEFQERIGRVGEVYFDKRAVIDHPWRITTDSSRTYLSARNSFIDAALKGRIGLFISLFINYFIRAFFIAIFLGKPIFLTAFVRAWGDFFLGRSGRQEIANGKLDVREIDPKDLENSGKTIFVAIGLVNVQPPVSGKDVEIVRSGLLDDLYGSSGLGSIKQAFRIMKMFRGKNLLLPSMFVLSYPPFSLLAQGVYWYDIQKGKTFLLYRNNPALATAFTILMLPLAAAVLPAALITFLMKRGMYKSMMADMLEQDTGFVKGAKDDLGRSAPAGVGPGPARRERA